MPMTLILINNTLAKQKGNLDPVIVYKNRQELTELSIIEDKKARAPGPVL